jgi:CO/xanthine dehydrogenase Mo-binding subunit
VAEKVPWGGWYVYVACSPGCIPHGIKRVGEIGLVPTAPAVAAALHDLDGVWRSSLPMHQT